jgi:signal transduction histidine kinase
MDREVKSVVGTFMTPRKRIFYRIILPFTLLFTVTTAISWMFSAYFVSRAMEQSLEQQMERVAGVISRSGYVLNPGILQQLKQVINSEIVVFDPKGRPISTTFADLPIPETITGAAAEFAAGAQHPTGRDITSGSTRYRITMHPVALPEHGQVFLSVWTPASETEQLKTRIVLFIGSVSLLGILAMAAAGYFIARTITAPVEELVRVTERVAGGNLEQRAHRHGDDEIGVLAESFNQMVERLHDYEQKAVESAKLATAGQLAAGLAHEIRNPLTSIRMLGQVLLGRLKGQSETQEMLHSMVREIDRLDRIIQELIDRARQGELRLGWHDVNRQVEEVLKLAEDRLAAQDISVAPELGAGLPELLVDRERVTQILWNLVLNAAEAMPRGGRLRMATRTLENGGVAILVEDSGQGFGTSDPEQLFQPFFSTKPEGMGLGLTVSRKIAEQHAGTLTLENRAEGGNRATLTLPLRSSDDRKPIEGSL